MHTQGILHTVNGKKFLGKNPNRGMADILVIIGQENLWIEVKSELGILSEYQREFKKRVERENNHFIVAKSVEQVAEYIATILNLREKIG
jgi:hypothetical protein